MRLNAGPLNVEVLNGAAPPSTYLKSADDAIFVVSPQAYREWVTRVSDALSPLDSALTGGRTNTQLVTELMTLTDSSVVVATRVRILQDVTVLLDNALRTAFRNTTASEALTFSDASQRILQLLRSDAAVITDAAATSKVRPYTISDAVTVADAQLAFKLFGRVGEDALTLSSPLAYREFTKVLLDPATLIDNYVKAGAITTKNVADSLLIVDELVKTAFRQKWFSDSVVLLDTLNRLAIRARAASDSITVIDSASSVKEKQRTASDALLLTDALLRTAMRTKSPQDAITLNDVLLTSRRLVRLLSDSAKLLDEGLAQRITAGIVRTVSETLTLYSQSVYKESTLRRLDSVLPTDEAQVPRRYLRTLLDALPLFDESYARFFRSAIIDDGVLLVDTADKAELGVKSRVLSDAMRLYDANVFHGWAYTMSAALAPRDFLSVVAKPRVITRSVNESTLLFDYEKITKTLIVADVLELDDDLYPLKYLEVIAEDYVAKTFDSALKYKNQLRVATSLMVMADALAGVFGQVFVKLLGDFLLVDDGKQSYLLNRRVLSDAVNVNTDIVTAHASRRVTMTETVVIQDRADLYRYATRSLIDAIARLSDIGIVEHLLDKVESLQVSDGVATFAFRASLLEDAMPVGDGFVLNKIENSSVIVEDYLALSDDRISTTHGVVLVNVILRLEPENFVEIGVDNDMAIAVNDDVAEIGVAA